jgi:phosphatidylserine/phosphatidylglycerophosphate/cardiolipin synthase-like enzyme
MTTITGSYNYSSGAKRNAENVVLINDAEFTKKFIKNWYECERRSSTK